MYFFMFAMALLWPICEIVIGLVWRKHPPKNINGIYGYRTTRSMKNQENWDYAQKFSGKIFIWYGTLELILSAIFMLVFPKNFYLTSIIVIGAECILVFSIIFIVERKLKQKFAFQGK